MRHRYFRLAAAAVALLGYWTPWLTHPSAALRLNGYELSEWVTFLPGVRSGELPLSRLLFLLPLACLALLLAIVATRVPVPVAAPSLSEAPRHPPERPRTGLAAALPSLAAPWAWPLLVAALLCALVVFPPYPYLLTALRDPEFQGQFFIACLTLLGLALVGYLPAGLKDGLQFLLGLAGALLAGFALLTLRPVASALLNTAWPIGLGWVLLVAGFAALAAAGLAQMFAARE
jgi:hypothetical protein